MNRLLLRTAGLIFVGLAAAGIVLPLLPTTPFLLLAGYCFVRSEPELKEWLLNHRVFGPYLSAYHSGTLSRRDRCRTIALLWLTLTASVVITRPAPWVYALLAVVGVSVTVHVATLGRRRTNRSDGDLRR